MCSAVTVECCVAWVCLLLCNEEGYSPVSAITERRDMGLYKMPLSMSVGFGMRTMLSNFHMCGIMLLLRAVFNMRVQEGICALSPDV